MSRNWLRRIVLCVLPGILVLSACNLSATAGATVTPLPPAATDSEISLATELPTLTPLPQPGLVVLLAPEGADAAQAAELETILADLAKQEGLRFEKRSQMGGTEASNDARLVVALFPDPGIAGLAQANPKTQFLAVGIPDVQAGGNVSTIDAGGGRADQEGFLAGYLAAVVTQDWRVGVIAPSDTASGKAAQNGFINGVVFYCGLCRPSYPPFLQYPIYAGVTSDADPAALQAAADTLIHNAVKTVYVSPAAAQASLLEYLAQKGLNIIGGATPPESVRSNWIATVSADLGSAVKKAWPRLMQGESGFSVQVPLALTDENIDLFSPGRQQLVEKTLEEIAQGVIDTGVDPKTGDAR